MTLLPASGAWASTVPVDALGVVGDEHVVFPPYTSPDRSPPSATVGNVGDVDGDGLEDTATVLDSYEESYQPSVWVSFSRQILPSATFAGTPGWRGFRIVGGRFNFRSSVAGLGDVNGDGLGEVVAEDDRGIVVVFGREDGTTVEVDELGEEGFRIDGVNPGSRGASGHGCCGSAYQNSTLTAIGDQSGDGRPDLAFRDGTVVRVAYTPPNPGGKVLVAGALGEDGYTLDTGADGWADPFVGRLGDLDGDGREDLAVAWEDAATRSAHGVGVLSPAAGSHVDLGAVADEGTGFEVVAPDSHLENAITMGDQNSDGRRDLGLVVAGWQSSRPRSMVVGFSPAMGTRREILPPAAGEGSEIQVYNGNVIDVGDQDGDGRSDLAFSDVVRLSSDGRVANTAVNPIGAGGALFLTSRAGIIVAALRDRNGDGKRELVVVHADPYGHQPGDYRATWILDVYASAPPPLPELVELPAEASSGDALDFTGTFLTAPSGGISTLGARPSVELTDQSGATAAVAAPEIVDASERRTRVSVRVGRNRFPFVPGETYRYRMVLENGRGLVGASDTRSFTYRPAGVATSSTGTGGTNSGGGPGPPSPSNSGGPIVPLPPPLVNVRTLIGTPAPDRLFGDPGRDLIRGLGGADLLRGGAGDDRLYGGSGTDDLDGGAGRDHLDGGPGDDRLRGGSGRDRLVAGSGADTIDVRDRAADVVACGPGRDRVTADRGDRLTGCERVRRSGGPRRR